MALAEQDIEFIKQHLGEWLTEVSLGKPPAVYEIELRERMIRVEEELKHQRELMQQGFAMMDKRFEAVDKRFEEITSRLDRFMVWSFSTTVTVGGLVVAILKLWN
jgi:predicted  nucleic acid-binding Zn-ribbon protein